MATATKSQRTRELAAIHCAKRDMGLEDAEYRDLLWSLARVRSAGDLDEYGRRRVLDHMRRVGGIRTPKRRPRVAGDRQALIGKIEAILTEAGRASSYADGVARRMFGIERYEWCNPEQLRKLVAALTYDRRRREARSET